MYKRFGKDGEFSFDQMVEKLKDFALENIESYTPQLYVSTDSQIFKNKISYATTIIMHKGSKDGGSGAGGIMFYHKRKVKRNKNDHLTIRIIQETKDSLEHISRLLETELLDIVDVDNFLVEIDAGMNGKSREIMKSCIGMVEAYGFQSRTKPYTMTTHSADKMCRK